MGNITMGGAGKTPAALAIAGHFIKQKKKVAFITSGYRGKIKDVFVDLKKHVAREVGDEPMLLAEVAPTYVCSSRIAAVKKLERKFEIIIFDDAAQYYKLDFDYSLLVFDGKVGIANGGVFPAGYLRESLKTGLKHSDAVLIVGKDATGLAQKIKQKQKDFNVFSGLLVPTVQKAKDKKVVAFAGIARPTKFFETLSAIGFKITKKFEFADHHFFSETEILTIMSEARKSGAKVITTAKDWVRLPENLKKQISFLPIELKMDEKVFKDMEQKLCKKQ